MSIDYEYLYTKNKNLFLQLKKQKYIGGHEKNDDSFENNFIKLLQPYIDDKLEKSNILMKKEFEKKFEDYQNNLYKKVIESIENYFEVFNETNKEEYQFLLEQIKIAKNIRDNNNKQSISNQLDIEEINKKIKQFEEKMSLLTMTVEKNSTKMGTSIESHNNNNNNNIEDLDLEFSQG